MPDNPKPPIENMPPEEGVAPPSDEQEAEPLGDFLDGADADADDTVDNQEHDSES